MFNLIKADLYRMKRSTSFYLIIFYTAFCVVLELFIFITDTCSEKIKIADQIGFINSGVPLLFIAFFFSTFITSEYKDGYIKNLAGSVPHRVMLVISKFIVSAVATLIIFAINILLTLAADFIFIYKDGLLSFEGLTLSGIILYLISQFLYYLTLLTIVMFFAMLTRSNTMGCVISFSLSIRLINELLSMLWSFLVDKHIVSEKIDITQYMVTSYMVQTGIETEHAMVLKGIIVAVVYFAIFMTLTIFTVKKRDI